MVFKLLVFMVAVSALEGVFGLPDKQLVNGTQSKANLGHGKAQRGRRLDKLACQIFHGNCQRLEDDCDGVLEEGPNWCLHSRHFGCCIQQSDTLGCSLNGRVYRDGAMTEDGCIIFICRNGEWQYYELNIICEVACIYSTTVMPFEHNEYNMTGNEGVYSFVQYGDTSDPFYGVDIYIVDNCIKCIVIYWPGLTVTICFDGSYPAVWVNGNKISPFPFGTVEIVFWPGPVIIIFEESSIYITCGDVTICINWDPENPWCALSVYVFASPSLLGELYGLSGGWVPPPDTLEAFIKSWQLPYRRSNLRQRKNPSSDHTGQVTVRPIIERSMSDIEKLCDEINKDPCTILKSEKCEKIMDDCVSRMSNVSKPGHGDFSDSSE